MKLGRMEIISCFTRVTDLKPERRYDAWIRQEPGGTLFGGWFWCRHIIGIKIMWWAVMPNIRDTILACGDRIKTK